MALGADLLHVDLRLQVVRTMSRDSIGKVPAEPVRWIVCNLKAIDAAHVARGTGWHKHVSRRKCSRIGIEVEQISLRSEHHTVLRFVVDLDLRVIGTHMALAACGRKTRKSHRTRVAGMALSTSADRSIVIGLADGMALLAARRGGRVSLRKTRGFGGRFVPPGWNCSLKETCSGLRPFSPWTAAQLGAA